MTKESIELISEWVTIIGFPFAIVTIFVAYRQFTYSKKVGEAKFWLELRQSFLTHNEVHLNLRNGGQWTKLDGGPKTLEEWAKVDAYLGQFELCQSMLKNNLINRKTFKSQYHFRLCNIVNNPKIVKKINLELEYWIQFTNLCRSYGLGKW